MGHGNVSFILLLEEKKKTVIIGIIYSGGDFCWQNHHCDISCIWLTFGQRWCRKRNTHSAVFMCCSINSKRVHTRLNVQPPVKSTSGPQSQFQRLHTNPQIVIWMKRKENKSQLWLTNRERGRRRTGNRSSKREWKGRKLRTILKCGQRRGVKRRKVPPKRTKGITGHKRIKSQKTASSKREEERGKREVKCGGRRKNHEKLADVSQCS